MSIKKRMKNAVKRMLNGCLFYWRKCFYFRGIRKLLNKDKANLPKLSKEQVAEIQQYWGNLGVRVPTAWHRLFYGKTGKHCPEFLPEVTFHQEIKVAMNEPTFASVWGDKAYIDYFVRDVNTVKSVIRNVSGRFLNEKFELIDIEQAQAIADQYDALVIKPSTNTHTGKGVKLLIPPYNLKEIARNYKKNYVIQIPIKQHEGMAKLNASSVNTIRVNSVLFDTEAYVMSAFVKVGQAGEFADNHGKNRYFIGIKDDGTYNDYAIDHDLNVHMSIPSGYEFANQPVPCFDRVCRAVERAHKCIPHFGFAYWDICVDENGEPTIVEINLRNPDLNIPQVALGGSFLGRYTEDIINYYRK